MAGRVPWCRNYLQRTVAEDVEITIDLLDLRLLQLAELRGIVPMLEVIGTEHGIELSALNVPSGMREHRGVADVIEMGMREDHGPDIGWCKPDIGELVANGPDHNTADIVGNDQPS